MSSHVSACNLEGCLQFDNALIRPSIEESLNRSQDVGKIVGLNPLAAVFDAIDLVKTALT